MQKGERRDRRQDDKMAFFWEGSTLEHEPPLSPFSPPVFGCLLFSSLLPFSHLFHATQPPPNPPTPTPSPPFLPLFRAQVTHPGGTIACDFIPMHRSETSALRYGILSLNNKQVDQPKYTSEEIDKSTRFSLRLDPHPKGRERKEA